MKSGSKHGRARERETQPVGWVIVGLVFASGFAGLVYQVLWMKQLGLLFGNTSHAAAATLAAFFAGLGAGSWWWGASPRPPARCVCMPGLSSASRSPH
jgi:predicted membrane-bound spermidine synthase